MNSAILSSLLTYIQTEPLVAGLLLVVFLLFVATVLLTRRVANLTKGADGKSLESTITSLGERVSALEAYARKNKNKVVDIERRVTRAIQGVSVERFDPFENAGQQSFCTALLNEHGDGAVISGIHSRDGVRVYAKEITGFKSERELSKEEQSAIAESKKKIEEK